MSDTFLDAWARWDDRMVKFPKPPKRVPLDYGKWETDRLEDATKPVAEALGLTVTALFTALGALRRDGLSHEDALTALGVSR